MEQLPRLDSQMSIMLIPCNHCKGIGLKPSRQPGILLPDRCPQCEGNGTLAEITFVPPIHIEKHGWIIKGAIGRIDTKGDRPFKAGS